MFFIILPLILAAFAIGMEKFLIIGIIKDISDSLGIELSQANLLITYYVFGIGITGPISIILLRKIDKMYSLLLLIAIFTIGNIIAFYSSSYNVLLIARIITSIAHAPFFGIASAMLTERFNSNNNASKLIAMLFSGLTISNIFGVPLGALISQAYGWRYAFSVIVIIGLISFIYLYVISKRQNDTVKSVEEKKSVDLKSEFYILIKKPEIITTLFITICTLASLFIVITYVSVILTDISGFVKSQLVYILPILGIGMTLGNFLGGKLYLMKCKNSFFFFAGDANSALNNQSDAKLKPNCKHSIMLMIVLMIATETIFSLFSGSKIIAAMCLFFAGFFTFTIVPFSQSRIIEKSKQTANLSSTFNIIALNIGSGIGSLIAGFALKNGIAVQQIPMIAIFTSITALLLVIYNHFLDKNSSIENQSLDDNIV